MAKDKNENKEVNKDVWAQAEAAAAGQNGGFAGVGPEGKKRQIQEKYDQLIASDEQVQKWAGDSDEDRKGVLGDSR